MDVKSAFLHARLVEKIYVKQPEGFVLDTHPNKVCLLLKSLYGLKQALHVWNKEIDQHLRRHGYEPTDADLCVYICHVGRAITFISLYVDDCTIVASDSLLQPMKDVLAAKFDMTDLGEATSVLGIKIICDEQQGTLALRQTGHIDAILECYGLADCKPVHTLMTAGLSLCKLESMSRAHLSLPYCQAVGSLMYIAQATQPNISFAIAYLSKFVSGYNESHWVVVKHVIRYLKATRTLSIVYQCDVVCDVSQLSPLLC